MHWGLRLRRTAPELALSLAEHVAFRTMKRRRRPDWVFSQLNTQPTCTSVYASRRPSRSAAQNSRPSGSLLLTRKDLSSSTSYRFIPAHFISTLDSTLHHNTLELGMKLNTFLFSFVPY